MYIVAHELQALAIHTTVAGRRDLLLLEMTHLNLCNMLEHALQQPHLSDIDALGCAPSRRRVALPVAVRRPQGNRGPTARRPAADIASSPAPALTAQPA